jgi:hypothetical protein
MGHSLLQKGAIKIDIETVLKLEFDFDFARLQGTCALSLPPKPRECPP